MNKKVLVISASPRTHGNSDVLCDQFIKGSLEAGNKVEKILLKDKNIHYCSGCGVCNSGKPCSIQDDMRDLLDKMIAADVIVMATPVYFYTMNAQMKTFIDRCCARYTEMKDKEFYFIIVAAEDDMSLMQRTIEGFRGFTSCLNNPIEKGVIYGVGAWGIGEIQATKAMQEAFEAGKSV